VLGNTGTLSLPVAPDSHSTVMDMIPAVDHVNSRMHFDAGNFCSAQFHHVVDVMDMVILDNREYPSHTSDDSALFAVMNIAAADNMASHFFFQPAMVLSPAYSVTLHLCGALYMLVCKVMVVVRIQIFSKRDTGTFAVADLTVFNDPSFGPVGSDHTILVSCRRRPGGCCFVNIETADSNIADACF